MPVGSQRSWPSWVPFGGMPAPTREIVEKLEAKAKNNRNAEQQKDRVYVSMCEIMQGLCINFDFVKETLRPLAEQFLRQRSHLVTKCDTRHGWDPIATTFAGDCLRIWELYSAQAGPAHKDFWHAVVAEPRTKFLLASYSAADIQAGEVKNPFADKRMPQPHETPHCNYPAMGATMFPVPLDVRKQLLLEFLIHTATKTKRSRRRRSGAHVVLHRPKGPSKAKASEEPTRSRTETHIALSHCPQGQPEEDDPPPYLVPFVVLMGERAEVEKLTIAGVHEQIVKAG